MTSARIHPEFATLIDSWELSLRADGFSENSVKTYLAGVRNLALWCAEHLPHAEPGDLGRDDLRNWMVEGRATKAQSTARLHFTVTRTFFEWLVSEDEIDDNPTTGLKAPAPGEVQTPVLTVDQLKRLLATCDGKGFNQRRDAAIIRVFVDGGLRLTELTELDVDDVDVRERILYVAGKGTRRSGPRHRAVQVGVRTMLAIDRYLRERRKGTYAEVETKLWLGTLAGKGISGSGVKTMILRRGEAAGIEKLHPHQLRHTWAHEFRANGGNEGDLMMLGGWRSRTQLDRYGASAAGERARDAYKRLSLGDRL